MNKQSALNILVPAKFIALALHIVVVTMAYFSYHDNIIVAYPWIETTADELYIGGRTSFLACNILSHIFLVIEILILFWGGNMFREQHNLISATLHYLGAMLWCAYIFNRWQFSQLWALWAVFSLIPFIMEIFTLISVIHK